MGRGVGKEVSYFLKGGGGGKGERVMEAPWPMTG